MTIGDKIKRVRELRKLTQKALADKIGMSETGYSKIERDETDIPFSRLDQIAKALNVKIEDIISFDEKYVFNNYGTAHDKSFSVNNSNFDKERELYEKTIKLLEDKIKMMEG
jgi:transcriptional regulator with XRE-family HTH domain